MFCGSPLGLIKWSVMFISTKKKSIMFNTTLSWKFSSKIPILWQDHIYFLNIKLNSNGQPGHPYDFMEGKKVNNSSSFEIRYNQAIKTLPKQQSQCSVLPLTPWWGLGCNRGLFRSISTKKTRAGQRQSSFCDVNKQSSERKAWTCLVLSTLVLQVSPISVQLIRKKIPGSSCFHSRALENKPHEALLALSLAKPYQGSMLP